MTTMLDVPSQLRTERGLRVLCAGRGPDVLLVGGLLDTVDAWDAQAVALSGGHRVIRYDARGTGRSPAPPGPYRLIDLVDDAVGVLDSAGVSRAHVVGSGLGGVVARRLALAHPERVRSLTLSGSWLSPDRALRALLHSWIWAAERALSIEELLHVVEPVAAGRRDWDTGAVDDGIAAAVSAEAHDGAGLRATRRAAFISMVRAVLEHDARRDAGELPSNVGVLVVAGDEDRLAGLPHSRELAAALPGARLEVIAGAGHRAFRDDPQAFNQILLEFLDGSRDVAVADTPVSEGPLRVRGPRLTLRYPTADDAAALFRLAGDPEVTRFFSWGPYREESEARAWLETLPTRRSSGTALELAIEDPDAGVIGITLLSELDRRDRRAVIGTWLGRDHWRTGANQEAKGLMAALAFDALGLERLGAYADVRNERSQRALERLGFTREGVLHAFHRHCDEPRDVALYALLRAQWRRAELLDVPAQISGSAPLAFAA